jgi:hypothetical protein
VDATNVQVMLRGVATTISTTIPAGQSGQICSVSPAGCPPACIYQYVTEGDLSHTFDSIQCVNAVALASAAAGQIRSVPATVCRL